LKLFDGVSAQPLVNFVPLDRAIMLHGAAQKARNVFHRQWMVALHGSLKGVSIQRANLP
jgi:hypothetical protein